MAIPQFDRQDALIVVDVQNDFCPGGALAVAEGDQVVPVLNRWIEAAVRGGAVIVATRDWHPSNHISFQSRGGPWPPHCVQGTPGAEFHPELRLPAYFIRVDKATDPDHECYSDFAESDLPETLHARPVRRVWVGGLALDYCVRATVLDALSEGFEVHLIADATRAVNPRQADQTFAELAAAGAIIEREEHHG